MRHITYTNPVYRGYFADPFVWQGDGEYYAIGTGANEAAGSADGGDRPTIFPLLRSHDLVSWRPVRHALVRPDAALGNAFWAPEVVHSGERWYLYYSVGHDDRRHQLRVGASDDPLGPYLDVAALTDPDEVAFAIDPHPFRDADGHWYLFHARDFLDGCDERGVAVRPGTALVVHPLLGMTKLAAEGRTVARARCDWQRFARDRPIYGGVFDWHTLEGPCVVTHDGRYYCLYSGGCWQTDRYGVDYVVADAVLGPWSDAGVQSGPRVLRTVPDRVLGPGHCSAVLGPDAATTYVVYHAWDPHRGARRMCIDALDCTAAGPRSSGPTWTTQRLALRESAGA